jgi:hypothetical protein
MPVALEQLSTAMLDYGECSESVIFQLENPIIIVEWSGPLQERHWLDLRSRAASTTSFRVIRAIHFHSQSSACWLFSSRDSQLYQRNFLFLRLQ